MPLGSIDAPRSWWFGLSELGRLWARTTTARMSANIQQASEADVDGVPVENSSGPICIPLTRFAKSSTLEKPDHWTLRVGTIRFARDARENMQK
jgi:hypothetical protein